MRKLSIILCILAPIFVFTQVQEKKVFHKKFDLKDTAPISISYYGNIGTHPGIKVGFDWNIFLIEKTKERKKQIKTIRKLFLITPSITFYHHKASHSGLIISNDFTWRRYSKRLYYGEVSLGLAYFGRFNYGETWEVNEAGNVTNKGYSSRSYFAPSLSFAFGKRILIKKKMPFSIFTKINTNTLVGYNASVLPEISIELGFRVNFSKGIRTGNTKTIYKSNQL